MSGLFDDDTRDTRRTLSQRDKEILYRNANFRCQNCGNHIEFDEMEIGHKTAWARGGRTTFKNSVCLCHRCNRLQGTDSWATFQKKQNKKVILVDTTNEREFNPADNNRELVVSPVDTTKEVQIRKVELTHLLQSLKIKQLKDLCDTLGIKRPQARDIGAWVEEWQAPDKSEYIKKIIKSNVDTEQIKSFVSEQKGG